MIALSTDTGITLDAHNRGFWEKREKQAYKLDEMEACVRAFVVRFYYYYFIFYIYFYLFSK